MNQQYTLTKQQLILLCNKWELELIAGKPKTIDTVVDDFLNSKNEYMGNDKFEWNDELAIEFCEYAGLRIGKNVDIRQQVNLLKDDFKKSKQQSVYKPPLGLMPEYIHKEKRLEEINAAVARYNEAGKEIPNEWVNEQLKLWADILKHRNTKTTTPIKDYEILSYIGFNGTIISAENALVHLYKYPIHSVRRLSDNLIFSMNETTNRGLITGIGVGRNNVIYFCCRKDGKTDYAVTIDMFQTENKILFTTYDNVAIYEGDKYFVLYEDSGCINEHTGDKYWTPVQPSKRFATKEKASEFIIMNKPVLSVNEIMHLSYRSNHWALEEKLKDLVSSKIKNQ